MTIRKTGLQLLLAVAAVLGSAASVLSATGPAIQYGELTQLTAQARA